MVEQEIIEVDIDDHDLVCNIYLLKKMAKEKLFLCRTYEEKEKELLYIGSALPRGNIEKEVFPTERNIKILTRNKDMMYLL